MNESKKFYLIMYGLWFLTFVAVWFCLSRTPILDNGNGADRIRNEIEQSGSHQQNAAEGIRRAEGLAETSKVRLDGAAGHAESIETGARDIADLIGECKQILSNVRSRGAQETASH